MIVLSANGCTNVPSAGFRCPGPEPVGYALLIVLP